MADDPDQPASFETGFYPEVDRPVSDTGFIEDETPDVENLIVGDDVPPLGRSWAFDFLKPGFLTSTGRAPLETHGIETLRQWIEKCLRTPRGSSPIYPPGYGIENIDDIIGYPGAAISSTELEERVRRALVFHPRITDIEDFDWAYDPDEEYADISFTVVMDHENERIDFPFSNFPLIT